MNSDTTIQGRILRHPKFDGEFARIRVPGDGSCFFHSLAHSLNIDNMRAGDSLTRAECGHNTRAWLLREDEWDAYREHIHDTTTMYPVTYEIVKKNSTFVDDYIINYISNRLNIAVVIVESPTFVHDKLPHAELCLLVVYHKNIQHYEPIVQIKDSDTTNFFEVLSKNLNSLFATKKSRDVFVKNIVEAKHRGIFHRSEPIIQNLLAFNT